MKNVFVVFAAVLSVTYGAVDWTDPRGGRTPLPTTESAAKAANWKVVSSSDDLKITWYKLHSRGFQIAFDLKNNLAGVRIAQKEADLVDGYDGITKKSGTFEEKKLRSTNFWVSDVLFANPSILRDGGVQKVEGDEVAQRLFVKRGGEWISLNREGCALAETEEVEQGCKPGFGLVFSDLKANSSCADLSPFYQVFDPKDRGDMVGFGWLVVGKSLPHSHAVSSDKLKELFPQSPACLQKAASEGKLRKVTVFLSYKDSTKTTCPSTTGNWVTDSCFAKYRNYNF